VRRQLNAVFILCVLRISGQKHLKIRQQDVPMALALESHVQARRPWQMQEAGTAGVVDSRGRLPLRLGDVALQAAHC
jgi:hypothetical protein